MADILLDKVGKRYGSVSVVESMSLHVEDGEFMVFVGPSGCGKSTTLRMIAGLEDATSGRICIGGRDVTALEPRDRNIAMVFQNYALYPHKTVYENLAFGLRMRKTPSSEIHEQVKWAAQILGIDALLARKPRQLSGGQMQRVSLGRALVRRPDAFLLDEPLSNLDAKLRVHMREELGLLHKRIGTSMVYVTHDQVEAMTLGQRIVVMHGGHVQQIGTPLEIYDRPANLFVAGFLGMPEMNFVEGRLEAAQTGLTFRSGPLEISLDRARFGSIEARIGPDAPVTLGVRPEHLRLTQDSSDTADGAIAPPLIRGKVQLVEQMGAHTVLVFATADGTSWRVLCDRTHHVQGGDPCAVQVQAEHLHLFSTGDGGSLLQASP